MYVTVDTELGMLRGQEKTSEYFSHKKYFSFQGIPFAKPPLGLLRFRDPEEPEAWFGVRDALKEGDDCPQNHLLLHTPIGDEDCLYLNVYTPKLDTNGELPVMVWIHGGGFVTGSGSTEVHGPDYLIEQDVVLVTINYRLFVLGFLCLDHEEVPGNAGLKDQVMALRWVQKNIARFGGNPKNVTIFGVSAGGGSVHHLLLSPLSQGLFQQAMVQSGTALNPWAFVDRATIIDRAFRLGKILGCDTIDSNTLLEFLRNVPVYDFLPTIDKILKEDEMLLLTPLTFEPCVEEPASSRSFLPAPPRELLKQGKFAKVPILIGATSAEGAIGYGIFADISEENATKYYKKLETFLIQDVDVSADSVEAKQISKELKQFYFGDEPSTVDKLDNFFELYGDILFYHGIDESIRLMAEAANAAPIYVYEFTHCLSSSFVKEVVKAMKPGGAIYKGICHGEDISFFFNSEFGDAEKPNSEDLEFIAKLNKMWATFARTGNPNHSGMEVKWEPIKKNSFCHLKIGKELKLVPERLQQKRMDLWQQLQQYKTPSL